jgi:hypothetical protein
MQSGLNPVGTRGPGRRRSPNIYAPRPQPRRSKPSAALLQCRRALSSLGRSLCFSMAQTTENACAVKSPGATASRTVAQCDPLRTVLPRPWARLARNSSLKAFGFGMLKCNCCMEAEWIPAMHFLGVRDDPKLPGVVRALFAIGNRAGCGIHVFLHIRYLPSVPRPSSVWNGMAGKPTPLKSVALGFACQA